MPETVIRKDGHYGFAVTPGFYCELCGPSAALPSSVDVTSNESRFEGDRVEGLLDGEAQRKACASCGLVIELVGDVIPIECRSYNCPECGRHDALEYRITEMGIQNLPDSRLTFGTEVKCIDCGLRRKFDSQLDSLVRCVQIELSPDGIELKVI